MLLLKEEDYLEVSLNSLIADYDRMILVNLYQPIIGYKAVSLYFTLLTEAENQKITSIIPHKSLFTRMQISAGDFIDSRKLLEAVGLLKTFVNKMKSNHFYQYELYAPKTPKLFFDNTLLYGMLIKSVGEVDANRLKTIYLINRNIEGEEITSSFVETFSPDLDDPAFKRAMEVNGTTVSRTSAKLISGFNYETFTNYIAEHSQINVSFFSKKVMKEIERLATLYGVNEESAAEAVINLYNPYAEKDSRIDFEELAKIFMEETHYDFLRNRRFTGNVDGRVSGKSDLARKINLMETKSPKDYLAILQNGTRPAPSDLKLINDLSAQYALPNCVINALIDYILATNDNVLARALCEKIAASLAREGIKTTIDAMNYLKKTSGKGKKKSGGSKEIKENPVNNNDEQVEEELDWDQMIKDLEEGNDDGEN